MKLMRVVSVLGNMLPLVIPVFGQASVATDPPEARTPFVLTAAYDTAAGRNAFFFDGKSVPPTIRALPGDVISLTFVNNLPAHSTEECALGPCVNHSNLHFHGLHVSPNSPQDDVLTMMAMPGESLPYRVEIPSYAAPGLYWYHTHPHGESARQDLDGMSGAIVIDGIDRYYPELRNMRERVLVLRDRDLASENAETRSRLLQQVDVVALDGMPLSYHDRTRHTRKVNHILVAPAGRVEAIVTGPAAGTNTKLSTQCVDTGVDGDLNPSMVIADMVSTSTLKETSRKVPTTTGAPVYREFPPAQIQKMEASKPDFTVSFTEDKNGFYINEEKFSMDSKPMLKVHIGSLQHWQVVNATHELHPFHIHQVHFLVYAVNGVPLQDPEWLDTVNVPYNNGTVDLVMDFTDPIIRGMSVFHCHLLTHEDKGMMAKILFE